MILSRSTVNAARVSRGAPSPRADGRPPVRRGERARRTPSAGGPPPVEEPRRVRDPPRSLESACDREVLREGREEGVCARTARWRRLGDELSLGVGSSELLPHAPWPALPRDRPDARKATSRSAARASTRIGGRRPSRLPDVAADPLEHLAVRIEGLAQPPLTERRGEVTPCPLGDRASGVGRTPQTPRQGVGHIDRHQAR
jgi:hypothetical protein